MKYQYILDQLHYSEPFIFVDEIEELDENRVKGNYTFREDAFFYKGHFKHYPVTPGVILTECCAQIGLTCLGIHLLNNPEEAAVTKIALVHSAMDFFELVLPNEKVTVVCEKMYYRFGKLKCKVVMYNAKEKKVCSGVIAGMINKHLDG